MTKEVLQKDFECYVVNYLTNSCVIDLFNSITSLNSDSCFGRQGRAGQKRSHSTAHFIVVFRGSSEDIFHQLSIRVRNYQRKINYETSKLEVFLSVRLLGY